MLTKAVAAAGGLAGGAMAGPVGAMAGQAVGTILARPAIALGESLMTGDDRAFQEELMAMGRDLSSARDRVAEAVGSLDLDNLEDVLSKDLLGWAVAHAADYGLNHLVPGANLVPGKGGAVAAMTVGKLHKAKQRAKALYQARRDTGPPSGLVPATVTVTA